LTLPRIRAIAAELPRDLIDTIPARSRSARIPTPFPSLDLDPVEVVKRIETSDAWMVLKRVENSPEYRALLEDTLLVGGAGARFQTACSTPASNRSRAFCSYPRRIRRRRFHLDSEDNFFVHIHGEKFFTVFDNGDRAIVDDDEIERSMTRHRNLRYDERFAARGIEFHLLAGDGCYIP